MKKLNLGCGEFKKDGYINVDYDSVSEPDIRHDLNQFPYPFADDFFDVIEADHLLEHLNNPFRVMVELHRIAKPGAMVRIKMPHFSRGLTHPQHVRGFDVSFPLYFNPSFKGGYQGVYFQLIKTKLRWFAQPYLKKTLMSLPVYFIAASIGFVIDVFANLSAFACSRLWCFWVGGFDEIAFEFKVIT